MGEYDVLVEDALGRLAVRDSDGRQVVHTFLVAAFGLLGADWDLDQVKQCFARYQPEESGPRAMSMNHGLVCKRPESDHGPVFFETKEANHGPSTEG